MDIVTLEQFKEAVMRGTLTHAQIGEAAERGELAWPDAEAICRPQLPRAVARMRSRTRAVVW